MCQDNSWEGALGQGSQGIFQGTGLWPTEAGVSRGGGTEEPFHQHSASCELICGILLSRNGSPVSAEEKGEEPPMWEPCCILTRQKRKIVKERAGEEA